MRAKADLVARVARRVERCSVAIDAHALERAPDLLRDLHKLTIPTLDQLDMILAQAQIAWSA